LIDSVGEDFSEQCSVSGFRRQSTGRLQRSVCPTHVSARQRHRLFSRRLPRTQNGH